MNKEQINNGEVRIFPFYKNEYMGELPFGYSNEKSARKFMKNIPNNYVYEKFGGEEEYKNAHEYVPCLDKNELLVFNRGLNGSDRLSDRKTPGIFSYKYKGNAVYLKDIEPFVRDEIRKAVREIRWVFDCKDRELVRQFEEKYDLFPFIEIDMDDY